MQQNTPTSNPSIENTGENEQAPSGNINIPKPTPETSSTPEAIGQEISQEVQTPEAKSTFFDEFFTTIKENFEQFTHDFKEQFSDQNGDIDIYKILDAIGLGGLFKKDKKNETQTENTSTNPSQSTSQNTPASSPTSSPKAPSPKLAPVKFERPISPTRIPPRPSNAPGGSTFMDAVNFGNMNNKENQRRMEIAILAEIERGNIPSFSRPENMKTVTMQGADGTRVSYRTSPDYLAVGSDSDYVRVPMTPLLAQELSRRFGWGLPTRTMTRQTYSQADIQLPGIGLLTGKEGSEQLTEQRNQMQGNAFILRHSSAIDNQLGAQGKQKLRNGEVLVAGSKKDVIISRYAIEHPGKLDFDGLYIDGKPIQQNPAHEDTYRDYSHGFRPVDRTISIAYPDGNVVQMDYYKALQDPKIAKILNGAEGVIDATKAYTRSNFPPASSRQATQSKLNA